MSYLDYFHLELEPFSNAPDRRFYFANDSHDQALERVKFAVENRRGLAVCVGAIGCGKTTLSRRLYDALDEDKFARGLLVVIHSDVTADWLLIKIAQLLGVHETAPRKLELLGQIYQRLREIDNQGRTAVIMIDEAQMFGTRELMEEFRGMLNLEVQGRKLVNFVFFGLPEVEDNLRLDEPLRQRVAVRCRLEPMSSATCMNYISHRLAVSKGNPSLFKPDVVEKIHNFTGGVPRLVNTFCDNMLLETWQAKQTQPTEAIAEKVAKNLDLDKPDRSKSILDELLGPPNAGVNKVNAAWSVGKTGSLDKVLGFLDEA